MSNVVSNVATGKPKYSGAVFRAPVGTPLPTNATSELNSAFEPMGYVSSEGVTNSKNRESAEIKAWGGDTVANPQTGKTDTFKIVFIESKRLEVLKAAHGDDNVIGDDLSTGITIRENSAELDMAAYVIETVMGGTLKRIVIPEGKPTTIGDVVYKDDDVVAYDLTFTAYPSTTINGDTHREHMVTTETAQVLGLLVLNSTAGSTTGKTAIAVAGTKGSGNVYKYIVASTEIAVVYGMDVTSWTTWNGSDEITASTDSVLTLVEATSGYAARKVGSVVVTAKAS